jgi:hypothetical protein
MYCRPSHRKGNLDVMARRVIFEVYGIGSWIEGVVYYTGSNIPHRIAGN